MLNNGLVMVARAFGAGETVDQIQAMIDNGTLQRSVETLRVMQEKGTLEKFLVFVEGIEHVNAKMDRILYLLEGDKSNGHGQVLLSAEAGNDGCRDIRGGPEPDGCAVYEHTVEPGSGTGNGAGDTPRIVEASFERRDEPGREPEPSGVADVGRIASL